MRRLLYTLLIAAVCTGVTGCGDRLDMEDATIPLLAGIDLDKDNRMLTYMINPVFSRDVKKKTQAIGVTTPTLRASRNKEDARTPGNFTGRKVQINLIGKRLLEQKGWFQVTDVYFRDAKNDFNTRVVVFDGPLSKIINLDQPDQPMLPLLLRGIIDTKNNRSEAVKTTMQELHRQMNERGVTPAVAEVQLNRNNKIRLSGTALMDHKGKYVTTINTEETVLLKILQKNVKTSVSMTLPIPGESKQGPFFLNRLSFNAERLKTRIKTSYRQGKFRFDIQIGMTALLTERLFPYDVERQGKELEGLIAAEVQKRVESLLRKIQKHRIDPIGLGLYARAYEYEQYKKVEDDWGGALAKADIHASVSVSIGAMGSVR